MPLLFGIYFYLAFVNLYFLQCFK